MKIVTRATAIKNLKKCVRQDLRALALKYGITTYETGKQNKGWKGLVLERLAGLQTNVSKAPNGLSYELKSVAFHFVKKELVPKETMAITMINPAELKAHSFFESHCWAKLKAIVFCAVRWNGKNSETAELIKVASLDFAEDDELIKEIKADYDFIREKLIKHGFESLTGRGGKWIQARTLSENDRRDYAEKMNRLTRGLAIWIPDEKVVKQIMGRLSNNKSRLDIKQIILQIREDIQKRKSEVLVYQKLIKYFNNRFVNELRTSVGMEIKDDKRKLQEEFVQSILQEDFSYSRYGYYDFPLGDFINSVYVVDIVLIYSINTD
ncbi:MAG: MutH/Sau3AI family endonuclease [Patescibacteria group bacterium]|nr:hypothetical protein [Patescibacteria group bacterium]